MEAVLLLSRVLRFEGQFEELNSLVFSIRCSGKFLFFVLSFFFLGVFLEFTILLCFSLKCLRE